MLAAYRLALERRRRSSVSLAYMETSAAVRELDDGKRRVCLENEEQSENHALRMKIDYGLKDNQNISACMALLVRGDCTEPRRFQPGTGRLRPHCDGDLALVGEILLELKKKDTISRNSTVTAAC